MMTDAWRDAYSVPSGVAARGQVRVPPSKSLAHRALICAALASGTSRVGPLPDGDDVAATLECLRALGAVVREWGAGSGEPQAGSGEQGRGSREPSGETASVPPVSRFTSHFSLQGAEDGGQEASRTVVVSGASGRFAAPRAPLACGASGTTLRLLMGLCGAMEGAFTLDGADQLRKRPVSDLEAPLRALGARVSYAEREGYPPAIVEGHRWAGGEVAVPGSVSSQFLSGLLLGAPFARAPVAFAAPHLVSASYAAMTAAVMERFGVEVRHPEESLWKVAPASYRPARFAVEPDASSAAFLWAAAAVTGGEVLVEGTGGESLQGDAVFPDLLEHMGCRVQRGTAGVTVAGHPLRGLDADCSSTPDLVPALAAVAAFAPEPSTFRGVAHLRFKESDRLAVLSDALSRLGATVLLQEGRMTVVPAVACRGAELDPQGDHRMAMAFAVLGLRIPGVSIAQPSCVAKSFPNFFNILEGLLS